MLLFHSFILSSKLENMEKTRTPNHSFKLKISLIIAFFVVKATFLWKNAERHFKVLVRAAPIFNDIFSWLDVTKLKSLKIISKQSTAKKMHRFAVYRCHGKTKRHVSKKKLFGSNAGRYLPRNISKYGTIIFSLGNASLDQQHQATVEQL